VKPTTVSAHRALARSCPPTPPPSLPGSTGGLADRHAPDRRDSHSTHAVTQIEPACSRATARKLPARAIRAQGNLARNRRRLNRAECFSLRAKNFRAKDSKAFGWVALATTEAWTCGNNRTRHG
jgi:hypothetical protein